VWTPPRARSQLKATFANADRKLWPGEFVAARLVLNVERDVLTIPSQAVMTGQSAATSTLVNPDRSVRTQEVTVGRSAGDFVVIEKGLARGQMVVTDGQLRLVPGAKVEVKAAADSGRAAAAGGGDSAHAPAARGGRMTISGLFIKRPVMTTLVMTGILLFGVMGYRLLPVSDLPNVDFPTIQVNASLPGGSPETMAAAVATPLEKQFSTIAGIDQMTSNSTQGNTSITLQFTLDRDIDAAAADVPGDDRQDAAPAPAGDSPADLPEGESGAVADPVPRAHLGLAAADHAG